MTRCMIIIVTWQHQVVELTKEIGKRATNEIDDAYVSADVCSIAKRFRFEATDEHCQPDVNSLLAKYEQVVKSTST